MKVKHLRFPYFPVKVNHRSGDVIELGLCRTKQVELLKENNRRVRVQNATTERECQNEQA